MSNPTSNFAWQMPTATDLVTDLPADFEVFGQAVDSSMADLLGGTAGQILAKNTNANMDFVWITNDVGDITAVTAGTGISGGGTSGAVTITNDMATTITASGDIVVGTGSGTYDNLPIGTTGQILTADTTVSPYKVKWATPGGSAFVGCSVGRDGVQSLSNATDTAVLWNEEFYDTDGFHSLVSNTSRFTIPAGKAGYYTITGACAFDTDNTGMRTAALFKNGAQLDFLGGGRAATGSGVNAFATMSITFSASVADYFEIFVYQNSGATQNLSPLSQCQLTYQGA
jgi:hypothetical protein